MDRGVYFYTSERIEGEVRCCSFYNGTAKEKESEEIEMRVPLVVDESSGVG